MSGSNMIHLLPFEVILYPCVWEDVIWERGYVKFSAIDYEKLTENLQYRSVSVEEGCLVIAIKWQEADQC